MCNKSNIYNANINYRVEHKYVHKYVAKKQEGCQMATERQDCVQKDNKTYLNIGHEISVHIEPVH